MLSKPKGWLSWEGSCPLSSTAWCCCTSRSSRGPSCQQAAPAARLAPYCSVADRRMVWHSATLILRPIGTASRVKYGILFDDIKIMVSLSYVLLSCIVVDSIRSCFMTLIMQSKDSFLFLASWSSLNLCTWPGLLGPRPGLRPARIIRLINHVNIIFPT